MRREHGWLIVLVVAALLVAACGPEMATPTPKIAEVESSPSPIDKVPTSSPTTAPAVETSLPEPVSYAELVDAEDYHALGSPDAPVTITEYSDFQ